MSLLLHKRDNWIVALLWSEEMRENPSELETALLRARRAPHVPAPLGLAVPDILQAYAIQRRLASLSELPTMVWKIGLTSGPAREAFNASEPIVGRLPASGIYCDRSAISFVGEEMYAEAELVFELARDLPAQAEPYTREQLSHSIKAIYAGIEIVRTRFESSDLPLGMLVADNGMAHGLVLGRKLATSWNDRFAELPVTLSRGTDPAVAGSTARVMGNPLDALVWLANWLRENEGGSLSREQLVATGTCTGATPVFPGDTVTACFDGAEGARITLHT